MSELLCVLFWVFVIVGSIIGYLNLSFDCSFKDFKGSKKQFLYSLIPCFYIFLKLYFFYQSIEDKKKDQI